MGYDLTIKGSSQAVFAGAIAVDELGADPCASGAAKPMEDAPDRTTTAGSTATGQSSTDDVAGCAP